MPAQSTNLFLLQDLENPSRTRELADSDLSALHSVADWIRTFVARPNKDLGRAGPVCPFVPGACERKTLWLAPERIAKQSVPDVVQLMNGYRRLLLRAQPIEGDDANYKAIVVVFTDHGIPLPRSGAGSMPCSFRIPRIVPRPSLRPRLAMAPWIRV
jgi:hypothetical protein